MENLEEEIVTLEEEEVLTEETDFNSDQHELLSVDEDEFSGQELEYIPNSGMDGPSDEFLCEECKELGYCKKLNDEEKIY